MRKRMIQVALSVAILGGVAWFANAAIEWLSDTHPQRIVPVLVLRDFNELRFTNDSDVDLANCHVQMDGGFSATLDELKPRARASLPRSAFGNVPRDEFYRRSRDLMMRCLDNEDRPVTVSFK